MNPETEALRQAARDTDGRFQTALVKAYGKRAGDMRYRTGELLPEVKELALAYQDACEEWRGTASG